MSFAKLALVKRCPRLLLSSALALAVAGCGARTPQLQPHEDTISTKNNIEVRIKKNIFCELVLALKDVRRDYTVNKKPMIPDHYGVQMQTILTLEESGSIAPTLTLSNPLHPGEFRDNPISRSLGLGVSGSHKSTATRIHTAYSYYNVGRIAALDNNTFCDSLKRENDAPPFLKSELGIKDYLIGASLQAAALPSSRAPAKGDVKLDIYSYEIKFAVAVSGGVNPTFTLVRIAGGGSGGPLFSAGTTRTHDLILTFGPGGDAPSEASLQQHFLSQIAQSRPRF